MKMMSDNIGHTGNQSVSKIIRFILSFLCFSSSLFLFCTVFGLTKDVGDHFVIIVFSILLALTFGFAGLGLFGMLSSITPKLQVIEKLLNKKSIWAVLFLILIMYAVSILRSL